MARRISGHTMRLTEVTALDPLERSPAVSIMKKLLAIAAISAIAAVACQPGYVEPSGALVPADALAAARPGDQTVCGTVVEVRPSRDRVNLPLAPITLVNFERTWPDQPFSIHLLGEDSYSEPDLQVLRDKFQDKRVCATGTITNVVGQPFTDVGGRVGLMRLYRGALNVIE